MNSETGTTAGKLLDTLSQRGVSASTVRPEHIATLHSFQNVTPDRPVFSDIESIRSRLPRAEPRNPVWAAVVETRRHDNLEFSIRNVHAELALPVQVFHGPANGPELRSALADMIEAGTACLTDLPTDRLDPSRYNALLLSPEFWHAIPSSKRVLVFQTDTIVCPGRQYELDDFDDIDLLGGNWPVKRPVGFCINGGNGGFSLRSKSLILECLDRFPPTNWQGGEDGYFGFHGELIGGKIGTPAQCSKFATQHWFRHKSLGAHKISCLSKEDLQAFLDYCPEAQRLLAPAQV